MFSGARSPDPSRRRRTGPSYSKFSSGQQHFGPGRITGKPEVMAQNRLSTKRTASRLRGDDPLISQKARLNEAFRQTLSRARCQQCACEGIRLGHKELTYDPPSQNDARRTRAS